MRDRRADRPNEGEDATRRGVDRRRALAGIAALTATGVWGGCRPE